MTKPFVLSDYVNQAFTVSEVVYIIGTARTTPFMSEHTLLLADQDFQIKINDDALWIPIHKNVYFESFRKIVKITVKRVTTNGNLEIWSEGNIIT